MRDGLDGLYWFSMPALAWLFRVRVHTIEALATKGKLGARRVENDIDYFQIYCAETYFGRSIGMKDRKAACRQVEWLTDVMENWRPIQ